MKKLVALLVVFGLATVASAATLDVTAADGGSAQLVISYQADVAPAGLALSLTLSGAATVDPATGVLSYDPCLPVHLDYAHDQAPAGWDPCDGAFYQIGEAGQTPIADAAGAGLPAGPTGTFSLCLGQVDTAPPTGVVRELCTLQIDCNGETDVDVTITADALRGEAAGGPEGTTWTVNVPALPVNVVCGDDVCFKEGDVDAAGHTVTAADVANWNAAGQPACWCYDCFAAGDATGDCVNTSSDLAVMIDFGTGSFKTDPCGDLNYDGVITSSDLAILIDFGTGAFKTCSAPCTPI